MEKWCSEGVLEDKYEEFCVKIIVTRADVMSGGWDEKVRSEEGASVNFLCHFYHPRYLILTRRSSSWCRETSLPGWASTPTPSSGSEST